MKRVVALALLTAFFLTVVPPARSAEKWADPRLTVLDGLELWLDAGAQGAKRKLDGAPPLKNKAPVECWYDGSGRGRHLHQNDPSKRPLFHLLGSSAFLRFDGIDDHLRATGLDQKLKAFTVFLVAAPHGNPGDFRAFLAINEKGKRDYETGFTIDLSYGFTGRFEQLNVEGKGFGGALDLMSHAERFGTLHIIEASADPKARTVNLVVDGKLSGKRPFVPTELRMDEITAGARYYTNGPDPQEVRGFLPGDIAEVLIYSRTLTEKEARAVREYLTAKHAELKLRLKETLPEIGEPVVTVKDPPPVQVLSPGFAVRQLPLDLPNINNVKYRPDGKLVAVAYNGDIYLLSDTDGDGLEDRAQLFWDNKGRLTAPIGMDLTPPKYKHGSGVFVASKGKCSLIVDTDGDDKADKEIVVATGWQPLPYAHGVDALGVAYDPKDGSIYFGLGTANYANAYLLDKKGKAGYRLGSERGTILRVAPDFTKREIFCTGIRFPVGLAFNRLGDLFCTDQEGATWLPNGNPFDELLHVQKGRHYGFPPRHPTHLPKVIDEPSVFDYKPQHQSTCGLAFNEPGASATGVFGLPSWQGDAFVAGYSRGKLYRTKLVKTPAGYVAQNHLFACLNMLTADVCVSPNGNIVVAVHSGGPDWGSGPSGKGKLYKIAHADKTHPQPVAVWQAAPGEVHVAFDRPLQAEHLADVTKEAKIEAGTYVSPGDRFEVHRPGYAVVYLQVTKPRRTLPVLGVSVSPDFRTLILSTPRQTQAVSHAVTLPKKLPKAKGELPQHPQIDLGYDLCGVTAELRSHDGKVQWEGWLPHIDLNVARELTRGSASHEQFGKLLAKGGTLTLRGKLDLKDMLRPEVQPGARLDHSWPEETVTLTFTAAGKVSLKAAGKVTTVKSPEGASQVTWTVAAPTVPVSVEIVVRWAPPSKELHAESGEQWPPYLHVAWHTAEDARPRALPLHRILLPWATREAPEKLPPQAEIAELKGGDWDRGRRVFFGEKARCSQCHAVGGEGGKIGPDLSNLIHRDYPSVLRDITEPSYAINPDFITHIIELKDGRVLTGAIRTEGAKLLIGDDKGAVTAVDRDQVAKAVPSPVSVMPRDLLNQLTADERRDLLTFLLVGPPRRAK